MTWGYNAAFRGHCCFYSFFKGPFDMQIWANLTKISEEWTSCFRNNWVKNTVISSWILLITCVFIHEHRFQSKTKYSPITNCDSKSVVIYIYIVLVKHRKGLDFCLYPASILHDFQIVDDYYFPWLTSHP